MTMTRLPTAALALCFLWPMLGAAQSINQYWLLTLQASPDTILIMMDAEDPLPVPDTCGVHFSVRACFTIDSVSYYTARQWGIEGPILADLLHFPPQFRQYFIYYINVSSCTPPWTRRADFNAFNRESCARIMEQGDNFNPVILPHSELSGKFIIHKSDFARMTYLYSGVTEYWCRRKYIYVVHPEESPGAYFIGRKYGLTYYDAGYYKTHGLANIGTDFGILKAPCDE